MVSWPAENTFVATRETSSTSGTDPSGNVAVARPVNTSSRGSRRRSRTYSAKVPYRNSSGLCASDFSPVPPTAPPDCLWSLRRTDRDLPGHAQQVGDHQQREGAGETLDEVALARCQEGVQHRSASTHMASSFSLRRFGVISRISRARWLVCVGGSRVGSWSLNGISSRCSRSTRSCRHLRAAPGSRETGRSPRCTTRRSRASFSIDRPRPSRSPW